MLDAAPGQLPVITPRVEFVIIPPPCRAEVKSPKSVVFPVVAISINSILSILAGCIYAPANIPLVLFAPA